MREARTVLSYVARHVRDLKARGMRGSRRDADYPLAGPRWGDELEEALDAVGERDKSPASRFSQRMSRFSAYVSTQ